LFYTIMMILFALLWGVLGLSNIAAISNPHYSAFFTDPEQRLIGGYAGADYWIIGLFPGYILEFYFEKSYLE